MKKCAEGPAAAAEGDARAAVSTAARMRAPVIPPSQLTLTCALPVPTIGPQYAAYIIYLKIEFRKNVTCRGYSLAEKIYPHKLAKLGMFSGEKTA